MENNKQQHRLSKILTTNIWLCALNSFIHRQRGQPITCRAFYLLLLLILLCLHPHSQHSDGFQPTIKKKKKNISKRLILNTAHFFLKGKQTNTTKLKNKKNDLKWMCQSSGRYVHCQVPKTQSYFFPRSFVLSVLSTSSAAVLLFLSHPITW